MIRIRRSWLERIFTGAAILGFVVIVLVALFTLFPNQILNLLIYSGNWVEYAPPDYDGNDLEWGKQVASPDGSLLAIIEPREVPDSYCPARIVIRDVSSFEEIAALPCSESYFHSRPVNQIAWHNTDTIALISNGSVSLLWRWRVNRFPFGIYWLTVYAILAVFAALIGLAIRQRRRTTPLEVENPID